MSDEAFARRFYADRAELLALGVRITLAARRVHRRGALHAAARAVLPAAAAPGRRRAGRAPDVPVPARGPVRLRRAAAAGAAEPRARPARTRPARRPTARVTLNLAGGGYSPEIAQRLAKLETAISKQRTIVFRYFAMGRGAEATRTVDPYSLYFQGGQWYVVGRDHDRDDMRVFRVSRIARRPAVRHPARARLQVPRGLRPRHVPRPRRRGSSARRRARPCSTITPSAAWLVERLFGRHGTGRDPRPTAAPASPRRTPASSCSRRG